MWPHLKDRILFRHKEGCEYYTPIYPKTCTCHTMEVMYNFWDLLVALGIASATPIDDDKL